MRGNSITLGNTNASILRGDEDLTLWSDEELLRGQRRAKNGRWMGRSPKVVPMAVHHELNRRRMSKAREVLDESLEAAVALFAEVVKDPDAPLDLRLKAAKEIVDRTMGKAPDKVSIHVEQAPWEEVVDSVVLFYDEDDIVDAVVVDPWDIQD